MTLASGLLKKVASTLDLMCRSVTQLCVIISPGGEHSPRTVFGVVCLVSFEGELWLLFISRSLSSLIIRGNPSALLKTGVMMAMDNFGSNW